MKDFQLSIYKFTPSRLTNKKTDFSGSSPEGRFLLMLFSWICTQSSCKRPEPAGCSREAFWRHAGGFWLHTQAVWLHAECFWRHTGAVWFYTEAVFHPGKLLPCGVTNLPGGDSNLPCGAELLPVSAQSQPCGGWIHRRGGKRWRMSAETFISGKLVVKR
jgi:hypothetical protein